VRAALAAALAVAAGLAAGCGGGGNDGEGVLRLVVGPGYVENGTGDPTADGVTPFERSSGCRVRTRVAVTTDELGSLVETGRYDGAAGLSDAVLRLAAAGALAPVEPRSEVLRSLRAAPALTLNGRLYGVPQGRGANLLMWRTDVVRPAPTDWGVVFDARSPYRGRVTAYDGPITIADAALHLRTSRPELRIRDPYELDDAQFAAAVGLLRRQREAVGNYWWDYVREQSSFASGDFVVGTTWRFVADLLAADGVPVRAVLPREGSTGWLDAWMVSARARNPGCMARWLDWMLTPAVNAQVAEWLGEAPANPASCAETVDERWCSRYHARDERWFSRVAYWRTPQRNCGDARGEACKDWDDWAGAWEDVSE
jgi:putative spermidine/putrescine transport system substrate-binding protein